MKRLFKWTALLGCVVSMSVLPNVVCGEANESLPPQSLAKKTIQPTSPHAKDGEQAAPAVGLPKEQPEKPRVKTLEPERAALGPIQIDPIPAPIPAANKRYARLPAYYSRVVEDKQRQQIYAIQRLYGPKLEELKLQYEALKKQRDAKIEQVLSANQRGQIEQMKLAAKAKRAKGKK